MKMNFDEIKKTIDNQVSGKPKKIILTQTFLDSVKKLNIDVDMDEIKKDTRIEIESKKKISKHEKIYQWIEENIFWRIENIWEFIRYDIYKKKILFPIQKISKGFCDEDVWSLHYWHSEILIKILRQLQKEGVGYPTGLSEKRWKKILNEMIEGFQAASEMHNAEYFLDNPEEEKKRQEQLDKKFNKGFELFRQWYFSLWD